MSDAFDLLFKFIIIGDSGVGNFEIEIYELIHFLFQIK